MKLTDSQAAWLRWLAETPRNRPQNRTTTRLSRCDVSDEKIVQALRELFVTWLESRPSFRTTVEVDAAWEGWKANTAVAAMLATHESRAQPASVADGFKTALEQIKALPLRPFPDPVGHSWEAFGRAVMGAFTDARMTAVHALDAAPQPAKDGA